MPALGSGEAAYSSLNDEVDDLYELSDVTAAAPAVPLPSTMPAQLHHALDSYAKRRAEDSDSDDDGPGAGQYADGYEDGSNGSSIEALLRKKAREGIDSDDDRDLERQKPAWATSNSSEGSNVKRKLATPAIFVILLVVLAAFFAGSRHLPGRPNVYAGAKEKLTLQSVFDGTFGVDRQQIDWLPEAGDGVYSYRLPDRSIMLHDLAANTTRELVKGSAVLNDEGIQLDYDTFSVSHDMRYILFGAGRQPVFRHSSRSNFYVHDLTSGSTTPLRAPTFPSKVAFAKWAPRGHSIAFVFENDLYVTTPGGDSNIRVTGNGAETVFNGVPDWVYEEEVFGQDSVAWWSPDGRKLAFLSFDETEVRTFSWPIYNEDRFKPGAEAYPTSYELRYPKPGTPNPEVTVNVFNLDEYDKSKDAASSTYELTTSDPLPAHDRVVTEVAWVGASELLVKETDRSAARERAALFDFDTFKRQSSGTEGHDDALKSAARKLEGKITRDVDWEKLDGGWAETGQSVIGLETAAMAEDPKYDPSKTASKLPKGYLEVVPDKQGFSHIAVFSPPESKEPVFLTSGDWEIDDEIRAVDVKRKLIYFIAAKPSTERYLYSISLPSAEELKQIRSGPAKAASPTLLTDHPKGSQTGFYDVSFSPGAGFYLLEQKAGIPWQRVEKVGDPKFDFPLTDNKKLGETLAKYAMPKTTYKTVEANGVSINVAETLPPNFDASGRTQYPLLLRPYGGPNSQTVRNRHRIDWTQYLASELGYIVVEADGRGTGKLGRSFRMVIRKNLGEAEASDQIAVAEHYGKLPYVDESRVGIQGWSYGGYLTAKVIERNSTAIRTGLAVAPVTDWRYYDTIYTERYMGTLESNGGGYDKASVTDMDGFRDANFLFMHGSGDDNVHYVNSANLLDRLTWAGVQGFLFRMFTDSRHNMGVRGAYPAVYREMTAFLIDKLGKAERVKHSAEQKR